MLLTIGTYLLAITLEAMFFWRVRHIGRCRPSGGAVPTAAPEVRRARGAERREASPRGARLRA